jgi:hypothetical protein
VLNQLLHDPGLPRRNMGIDPTDDAGSLPYLSGERPCRAQGVGRPSSARPSGASLVTNFWYIRPVNPSDLTLTGMTRDGTFLIENGGDHVGRPELPVSREPPCAPFNQVETYTAPVEAVTSETGKFLVPAMRINGFNFSSVTRF